MPGALEVGPERAVVDAPVIALLDVKGMKGAKPAQLLAAMEIARRVSVPFQRGELVIKSTHAAADYLRERMRGLADEQFRVLYLNRRKALLQPAGHEEPAGDEKKWQAEQRRRHTRCSPHIH